MRNLKPSHDRPVLPDTHALPSPEPPGGHTRRRWLERLGTGALLASMASIGYALARSLVPNVLYEPSRRFKAGLPAAFPEGVTFLEDQRVFIFKEKNTFHAISAVCTHLGCTVKMVNLNQPKTVEIDGKQTQIQREFHCPCHGSKYYSDGTNYDGPAPQALAWHKVEVAADDGSLVVNLAEPVNKDFRLTV
jgi:menaquinol-cytochrome c reductase iron-sulfur subunit